MKTQQPLHSACGVNLIIEAEACRDWNTAVLRNSFAISTVHGAVGHAN